MAKLYESMKKDCGKDKDTIRKMQNRIDSLSVMAKSNTKAAFGALHDQISSLEQTIAANRIAINVLRTAATNKDREVDQRDNQIYSLEQTTVANKAVIEALRTAATKKDKEIEDLKEANRKRDQDAEILMAKIRELNAQSELEALATHAAKDKIVRDLNAQIKSYVESQKLCNQKHNKDKAEIKKFEQLAADRLGIMMEKNGAITTLQEEIGVLKGKIGSISDDSQNEIRRMELLSALKSATTGTKDLEELIEQQKAKIKTLTDKLIARDNDYDLAMIDITEAKERLNKAELLIEKKEHTINSFSNLVFSIGEENNELTEKLATSEHLKSVLTELVETLRKKLDEADKTDEAAKQADEPVTSDIKIAVSIFHSMTNIQMTKTLESFPHVHINMANRYDYICENVDGAQLIEVMTRIFAQQGAISHRMASIGARIVDLGEEKTKILKNVLKIASHNMTSEITTTIWLRIRCGVLRYEDVESALKAIENPK
jgi:chromosome segregation ATPase